mgnify:CR=1 FL=1
MTKYHIVALGGPGSGKTVYISALYYLLANDKLAPGIRMKTSLAATSWLNEVFEQVSDPNNDFPPGTNPSSPMREVEFQITCERMHRPWLFGNPRLLRFPVMEVSYVDYSGEWLTESHTQSTELLEAFESRLAEAHVILAFIDGERISRMLLEPGSEVEYVNRELRPIVKLAEDQSSPIVIVLTKWDLLMAEFSLNQVVAALMADESTNLRNLADARSAKSRLKRRPVGGVWLVPVSATGPNFARWDGAKRRVVKTGRGSPEPINVTIPFTIGITEIASVGLKEIKRAANRVNLRLTSDLNLDEGANIFTGEVPIGIAGVTLDLRKLLAFSGDLAIDALRILSVPATRTGRMMRRGYRRVTARGLDGVNSIEGALMHFSIALRGQFDEFHEDPKNEVAHLWADSDEWVAL